MRKSRKCRYGKRKSDGRWVLIFPKDEELPGRQLMVNYKMKFH